MMANELKLLFRQFCQDWLDGKIEQRESHGLCRLFKDYAYDADISENKRSVFIAKMFRLQGLDIAYPFNQMADSDGEFDSDMDWLKYEALTQSVHKNPRRVAFVKKHAQMEIDQ